MVDIFITALLAFIFGALVSWVCKERRVVSHYHYYNYKKSKDYERLWDLLQQRWKVFVVYTTDSGTTWCDIARIHDYEYGDEAALCGFGHEARNYWRPENKSKFIGYCMMRDYEFFDPVDEVKE